MQPNRFCSVGGNGIKLYSNVRANASVRCDQSANYSSATWIATSNRNCHKPPGNPQSGFANNGNSLTLTAVCNVFGGSWRIQPSGQNSGRRIEFNFIHRNLRTTVLLAAIPKIQAIAPESAPTAGSQGKVDNTPNALPWQEKRLHPGSASNLAPTRLLPNARAKKTQEPLATTSGSCTMACQRPPELAPSCEENLKLRGASAMDAALSGVCSSTLSTHRTHLRAADWK